MLPCRGGGHLGEHVCDAVLADGTMCGARMQTLAGLTSHKRNRHGAQHQLPAAFFGAPAAAAPHWQASLRDAAPTGTPSWLQRAPALGQDAWPGWSDSPPDNHVRDDERASPSIAPAADDSAAASDPSPGPTDSPDDRDSDASQSISSLTGSRTSTSSDTDGGSSGSEDDEPDGAAGRKDAQPLLASKLTEFQRALVHWHLQHGCSVAATNELLALFRRYGGRDVSELPRRIDTMLRRVDARADLRLDPSSLRTMTVTLDGGETVAVRYRDLWSAVKTDLLENDRLGEYMHFDYDGTYQRGSRDRRSSTAAERVYGEMWTANWWRAAQERLDTRRAAATGAADRDEAALPGGGRGGGGGGRRRDVAALIIHIDGTSALNKSVTPVTVTLGNLPMAIRRQEGSIASVAYIPVLTGPERVRNTDAFRHRKRMLLHKVMAALLSSLAAVHGGNAADRDGGGELVRVAHRRRFIVPLLAMVIADNDEKCRLTMCFGKYNSAYPCWSCWVPGDMLGNASHTSAEPYPHRSAVRVERLHQKYHTLTTDAARRRFRRRYSMHFDPPNALFDVPGGFDPFTCMPPEALHDLDLGVVRWFMVALLQHLEGVDAPAVVELDRRLQVLTTPPIPGLKSFGEAGYTGLSRHEGAHFRALVQLLPLALIGLSASDGWEAMIGLATRLHLLYQLARDTAVAESTLEAWQVVAGQWASDFQRHLGRYLGSDGEYPKLHYWLGGHLVQSVRKFGSPLNYESSPFERFHISNIKRHTHNIQRSGDWTGRIAERAARLAAAGQPVHGDMPVGGAFCHTTMPDHRPARLGSSARRRRDRDDLSDDDDDAVDEAAAEAGQINTLPELHGQGPEASWADLANAIGMPLDRLAALLHEYHPVHASVSDDGARRPAAAVPLAGAIRAYSRMRLPSTEWAYALQSPLRRQGADAPGSRFAQACVEMLRPQASRDELPWLAVVHGIVRVISGPTAGRVLLIVRWLTLTPFGAHARRRAASAMRPSDATAAADRDRGKRRRPEATEDVPGGATAAAGARRAGSRDAADRRARTALMTPRDAAAALTAAAVVPGGAYSARLGAWDLREVGQAAQRVVVRRPWPGCPWDYLVNRYVFPHGGSEPVESVA